MQVSIFARKADLQDLVGLKAALKPWNPRVFQYAETARVKKEGAQVVVLYQPLHAEELARLSAEVRLMAPNCYLVVVGEHIPGMALFHAKVNVMLQPGEQDRIPELVREVEASLEIGMSLQVGEALQELRKKNEELEKINYELDRFVYSASHDLRSPLTSVLGLLYLLREEIKSDNAGNLINLMEDSIHKLDNIIKDIVAYSRNNRTDIQLEEIKLRELVNDVEPVLRYLENDEISIGESVIIEGDPKFLSDRNRLVAVFNNLISNSIKYRHHTRKPEVHIACTRKDDRLVLTVRDNGIGIKEYHLDKIFDMFYRTSDHSTGSGLGLYIVRETIKKLGGTISVESAVNQGTTFTIELPGNPS
jgi:signal transduction histidine kinase